MRSQLFLLLLPTMLAAHSHTTSAQIGQRSPSEKKAVPDPVTGVPPTSAYFRMERAAAAKLLPAGPKIEGNFGPRNMGAGPSGWRR